jgi:xylulokinase
VSTWLGLDIGTSALKGILVEDDGKVIGRASAEYHAPTPTPSGVAEQDPAIWIEAAARVIHILCTIATPAGVGLTGQVPTLVLVDAKGAVVRPAMTWQDARATVEAERLAAELGNSLPHLDIDLPWSATQLPAKLAWIAAQEPEHLRADIRALQPKDFLGLRLTGNPATDPWSAKGIARVPSGEPAETVLAAAGWTSTVVPPVMSPGMSRGLTTIDALGLPAGIPVSVGWSDALASMAAVGAMTAPTAFILTGTSDIVGMSATAVAMADDGLFRIPSGIGTTAVLYGPTQSSGASVAWAARLLGESVGRLSELAATADPASTPTFVPYLSGERAPLWDPSVRAVFAGVDAASGRAEFARAILRGVTLSAAHILDIAQRSTTSTLELVHLAGRAADDPFGLRLRLEALGMPIAVHPEPYVSALGAAMLGAAAANAGDLRAGDALRSTPTVLDPTPAQVNSAAEALPLYIKASQLAQNWSSS